MHGLLIFLNIKNSPCPIKIDCICPTLFTFLCVKQGAMTELPMGFFCLPFHFCSYDLFCFLSVSIEWIVFRGRCNFKFGSSFLVLARGLDVHTLGSMTETQGTSGKA